MKVYTYENYIECIHKLRLNAIFQIAEDCEEYEAKKNNNKGKKIKAILSDKEEAAKLINNYLGTKEKIEKEDLTNWKSNYINNKYGQDNTFLIYKQKRTETFFLIDTIESVNDSTFYKLLNYCIDIIYEWSKNRKFNSNSRHPRVIPIIIYTGNKEWSKAKKLEGGRIGLNVLENYQVNIQLNVIETRKLSNEFLQNQKSLFR